MTKKLVQVPPIPLPKGWNRGGRKGITAELLDRHENLVVSTLKIGQETAKVVSWRLSNKLAAMGSKWMPDPDFMNALAISAKVSVQYSAEYRQIVKIRSAGSITDEELLGMMKPLLIAVLDAMTDEEFVQLLEDREELKRGDIPKMGSGEEDAELVDGDS